MKDVDEVVACVVDFGTFLSVAERLGETMKLVYYHSPHETEYQDIREYVKGDGLDNVIRLDDVLDPGVLDEIDLFVFPDIGFTGLQRHLREIGKAVWGHMGATELELYRTRFLDMLEELGLPMVHNERVKGLTALSEYLKQHENVWVKIDRARHNMETWKSRSWKQSQRTLDSLAVIFGGMKEYVQFIVQDDIESDIEIGYDGWCINGKYPYASFQGYEKKNESYLGSVLDYEDLPDEVRDICEAVAPKLAEYGFCDWVAYEIRVQNITPFFIDITPRMAGQTMEHQLESIANFPEIIWAGANQELIEPEFEWTFAAEATLHYDADTKDPTIVDEWKSLELDDDMKKWVKLYHYCRTMDGEYQFPNRNTDEIGVVIGLADDCEESIEDLKEHLEALKDLPVHADVASFAELLKSIKQAEKAGISFGGRIPQPEVAIKG